MKVISNTGPIIGLLSIGRMDLLWELFDGVVIPQAVKYELCADTKAHQSEAEAVERYIAEGKLTVYQIRNEQAVKELYGRLHFGELEVIIGAQECGIPLAVIDEIRARKMAAEFLVDTIGIMGILSLAKRRGVIDSVRQDVDRLRKSGYWISKELYHQFLEQNGELEV